MKRCEDIEKRLSAYLEGDIGNKERELIEEHLASCRQCNKTFEGLKKTTKLVRSMEEIEPPPWLKQRIMTRIRDEAQHKRGVLQRLFFPLHIKIPIEAFATCLVVVMTLYVFKSTMPETKSLQPLSGQEQTAGYSDKDDKNNLQEALTPAPVLNEKKIPAEHRKKDTTTSPQAQGAGIGAVTPGKNESVQARPAYAPPATPAPAAHAPFAPAPAPALPEGEQENKGGRETIQSEPPSIEISGSIHKKKEDKAVADTMLQNRVEEKTSVVKPQLKASAVKKQQTVTITVRTGNVADAGREIESFLDGSGAKGLKQASQEDAKTIIAVLSSQKLKALHEKLKTIGDVKENILLYNISEGDIMLSIKITGND